MIQFKLDLLRISLWLEKLVIFVRICEKILRAYEYIRSKNFITKTPKRTILTAKWNYARGLLSFFLILLLLTACDQKCEQEFEYIYRESGESFFTPPKPTFIERTPFPWEDKYQTLFPKITKDFFRCRGSSSNPTLVMGEGDKKHFVKDCRSSDRHGLPLREGKEFIYPCLIDILNFIQTKTQKRVIITSGHRCPDHNAYVEPLSFSSKHMIGAEVDFYVEGLETKPDKIIHAIQGYYKELGADFLFKRESDKCWINKEVAVKFSLAHEKRNFDNQHPYPYITLQVRYDRDRNEKVSFNEKQARNFLRN